MLKTNPPKMVTPALKFGWPITIIRRKISKTFRFLIQFCSLCATKPKKKLDWKRSSTPHLTSFHEMRWREKNCLRKFESIEKTFQLLPIWREQVVCHPNHFHRHQLLYIRVCTHNPFFNSLIYQKESRYSTSWKWF